MPGAAAASRSEEHTSELKSRQYLHSSPTRRSSDLPRFGMDVVLAHPPEYGLMPETVEAAFENARRGGGKFSVVDNMDDAFRDADVVIPKSWGCLDTMGE